MAILIPQKPRKFDPASQEGLMFEALANLPNEYYVFHSFKITDTANNIVHESETDFVIYNRKLGVISLEAKAGQVHYSNGEWLYGNGVPMHNDGPFNQASNNKHKLRKYISQSKMHSILEHCKFLHAVWFPSISDEKLLTMSLPSEADKRLVLTKEALQKPEEYILRVFSLDVFSGGKRIETHISENESKKLIREIFCPEFEIVPTYSFENDLKELVFHRLLKEQTNILNFLDEQKTAAINGAAGTGKTMIAVEKARRHSSDGDSVLFLCFNSRLRDYLSQTYPFDKVAYYTIAGFVCKLCDSESPDYEKAKDKLTEMYVSSSFPYKHVIIDEGQDFGNDVLEEADIIKLIYDIVTDGSVSEGSFYVFYDKYQMVHAKKMPDFINELDCRLTLHRNCRNTENIATTSLRPITERPPMLYDDAIKGTPAKLHYCSSNEDEVNRIDKVIDTLKADGVRNIVILTCKTEGTSILSQIVKDGKYRNEYIFTTCRKYKGLEADAVILMDVDKETFIGDNIMLYYVGASRARFKLDIMTIMSDEDCAFVLNEVLHYAGKLKKAKKDLAGALNSIGSLSD